MCPSPDGLFSFQSSPGGELSYKAKKVAMGLLKSIATNVDKKYSILSAPFFLAYIRKALKIFPKCLNNHTFYFISEKVHGFI